MPGKHKPKVRVPPGCIATKPSWAIRIPSTREPCSTCARPTCGCLRSTRPTVWAPAFHHTALITPRCSPNWSAPALSLLSFSTGLPVSPYPTLRPPAPDRSCTGIRTCTGCPETVKNVRRVQRRVFLIVPITAIFTLLLAGTLGLAITRSITQPLERLVEGSKALARGEFQHQVAISGGDELAHLGQVFNDTSRQLQDLYATLRSSEDRLQRVIDTIPAHVWSARPDGTVDFINQRWVESAGLSLEKGVGWDWSSLLHPEDRARFLHQWQAALAAGEPMDSEARLARTDGKYGWWLIRIVPLRDNQGKVLNWYGVATDIEDRKRAEEEREKLRQLEADLAHVNRVSMMGELAASLAHEIRQPIAATITNAQTCLRWLKRDQPDLDEVREAAGRIVKDGTRAADIISHMRSLYKKSAPQRELVNLNQIIRELLVLLRGEATRYSISMRTELASSLPEIIADPVQLQQVFINLMLNAIEAMKETRGELIIKSQLDQNGKVLISVSDTGVGLPNEEADKIFNAFFTTKPQGSGMGLAISRSIVESHGGRLWATPNSERGASFHFTLSTEAAKDTAPTKAS